MSNAERSERELILDALGFSLNAPNSLSTLYKVVVQNDASLAFSGYGEFTPITVRSETVLENANLERDKR